MKAVFDFLKPRTSIIFFSVLALTWQYFYSFAQYNQGYFKVIREYLKISLDLVAWENVVIRTLSLGLIWIIVALVIFLTLVAFENFSIFFYNRRVEKEYLNRPKEDFDHLLKKRELTIKRHLPAHLLLSAAFLIYLFSIITGTDFIENIRGHLVENYFLNLQWTLRTIDFNASMPQVISFLFSFVFWYLISCLANFLYRKSSQLHEEEKIVEDHYGAIIP